VAAQRHPFALRITGVGEIVISLRIVAERLIVLRRREPSVARRYASARRSFAASNSRSSSV